MDLLVTVELFTIMDHSFRLVLSRITVHSYILAQSTTTWFAPTSWNAHAVQARSGLMELFLFRARSQILELWRHVIRCQILELFSSLTRSTSWVLCYVRARYCTLKLSKLLART